MTKKIKAQIHATETAYRFHFRGEWSRTYTSYAAMCRAIQFVYGRKDCKTALTIATFDVID